MKEKVIIELAGKGACKNCALFNNINACMQFQKECIKELRIYVIQKK